MDAAKIGKRLRELRGRRSIKRTADEMGLSYSTLEMYELGQRIPRDGNKIILAHYYGVSVEELFFADDTTKSNKQQEA